MKIKFCGAAEGVTGSCHLITVGEVENPLRFLLDCGLFQGGVSIEKANETPFPFDPAEISFVLLSHAHIDHCGRLPLLYKRGFRGKIYCTDATADLIDVMLRDAAYIQEKDAEWKSRKEERAGRQPVDPLYTIKDAEETLKYVFPVMYSQLIEPASGVKFVFNDAGHIFGSAITEIWTPEGEGSRKTVFSGDLGRGNKSMLNDPSIIKKADTIIVESTYGNRLHDKSDNMEKLINIILETIERGGNVIIPSFAVGRTQEIIYELNTFFEEDAEFKRRMKDVKVYVDSPMATAATEVFRKNAQVFDEAFKQRVLHGDDPLDFDNLEFTKTTAESQALNEDKSPKIIISASGMCEAGRIRHHLKHNLWKPNSSIVFVGYQGEGTLGRKLIDGVKTVKLFGEEIYVNAKIHNLEGFSGHADRDELLSWLKGFVVKPNALFIVHGELQAKEDFAASIKEQLGLDAVVVTGVSEYEPKGFFIEDEQEVMEDIMDEESLASLKARISIIKDSLEELLYKAELAATKENDGAVLSELNERLLALEKDTIGLAGTVSER